MNSISVVLLVGAGRPLAPFRRAIEAIEAQAYRPKEILVVLNGVTPSWLGELNRSEPFRCLQLPLDMGCAPGRNIGAAAAHGDVLLFLDDDGELALGSLEALALALEQHPDVVAFAGCVLPPDSRGTSRAYENLPTGSILRFSGGSFAIRRDIFLAAGGYWTSPLAIGRPDATRAEEYHLALRLLKKQQRIQLLPDLILFHPSRADESAMIDVGSAAGLIRTFAAFYPLPAAAPAVLYKYLSALAPLVRQREWKAASSLTVRCWRELLLGLAERAPVTWRAFLEVRRLDRVAPVAAAPDRSIDGLVTA